MPRFAETEVVSQPVLDFLRSGSLPDMQALLAQFASTTQYGVVKLAGNGQVAALLVVQANDTRLFNARSPIAHASRHEFGGSDPIKLDDLDLPDDNTDLDATAGRHGLMAKADKVKLDGLSSVTYPEAVSLVANVNLNSNSLVHVDSATGEAVKADASLGLEAHAFTRASVLAGQTFDAYQIGLMNGFAGLSAGLTYWLGNNGLITAIAPTSSVLICQEIGSAASGNELALKIEPPISF